MFLPAHLSFTIHDGFDGFFNNGSKNGEQQQRQQEKLANNNSPKGEDQEEDDEMTWPMWPFRLFQLQICNIYICTCAGKLNGSTWLNGTALYFISYDTDCYGGMFNPDFLFNRMPVLKIMTYAALWIEVTSWIIVWIKPLRWIALTQVTLLHIGIDLSMNMHVFEWLTLLGWCVFLVDPVAESNNGSSGAQQSCDVMQKQRKTTKKKGKPSVFHRLVGTFLFFSILISFFCNTLNIRNIIALSPKLLHPALEMAEKYQFGVHRVVFPILNLLAIEQDDWSMYYDSGINVKSSWAADVFLKNGTSLEWRSPDYGTMHWLEKKKYMRKINYIETIENFEFVRAAWAISIANSLTQHEPQIQENEEVIDDDSSMITSIVWYRCDWLAKMPREGLGWFDPAREPTKESRRVDFTLTPCRRRQDQQKSSEYPECDSQFSYNGYNYHSYNGYNYHVEEDYAKDEEEEEDYVNDDNDDYSTEMENHLPKQGREEL